MQRTGRVDFSTARAAVGTELVEHTRLTKLRKDATKKRIDSAPLNVRTAYQLFCSSEFRRAKAARDGNGRAATNEVQRKWEVCIVWLVAIV